MKYKTDFKYNKTDVNKYIMEGENSLCDRYITRVIVVLSKGDVDKEINPLPIGINRFGYNLELVSIKSDTYWFYDIKCHVMNRDEALEVVIFFEEDEIDVF